MKLWSTKWLSKHAASVLLVAGFAGWSPALGQDLRLEGGLSTLGLYLGPSISFADHGVPHDVRLRTPIYLGHIARDVTLDGNTIDARLRSTSAAVMGDYELGGSGFRFSGGLAAGGYRVTGTVDDPRLDDIDYSGTFNVDLRQRHHIAPVVAFGYSRGFGGNIGVMAELGGRLTTLRLSTTGQQALDPDDRATFNQSIADINDDLRKFGVVPFVTIGMSFRF